MTQKFHRGDLVHVVKDLGSSMSSHFTADVDAIVIGSYNDKYGGGNTQDYTLHLKGSGQCSWYHESQLELLERNRSDILTAWEAEREAERAQQSDIDWIFDNGPDLLVAAPAASVATLAAGVGITNLWGSHGEGLSYYENSMRVIALARPYLQTKNKEGWLALCEKMRLPTVDYVVR
jgi:hypothetical protein